MTRKEFLFSAAARQEAGVAAAKLNLPQPDVVALKATKRLVMPEGQPAYLTHLGFKYRDWPSAKIDAELPSGLRAAHDGLEVVLG